MGNDMFFRMCKEAYDEVASGQKGWRDIEPNVLIMACFHMLNNHLAHKITRPLWWFAGSVSTAVIAYLAQLVIKALSWG